MDFPEEKGKKKKKSVKKKERKEKLDKNEPRKCCCIPCCSCCPGRQTEKKPDANECSLKGKVIPLPDQKITIPEYFFNALNSGSISGKEVALIYNGVTAHTFETLWEGALRLAVAITNEANRKCKGVVNQNREHDIVIGFCLGNTPTVIETILATLILGGTYLALDITYPEEKIVRICSATKPLMVIIQPFGAILARFLCIHKHIHVVPIDALTQDANKLPTPKYPIPILQGRLATWERAAGIYYTSGTLGNPKGARISHRGIFNRVLWQEDLVKLEPQDICCLITMPNIHTSIADMFCPLLTGIPLVLLNKCYKPRVDFLMKKIEEHSITRITLSSTILSDILNELDLAEDPDILMEKLSRIKTWLCPGDNLTIELAEKFFANFCMRRGRRVVYDPNPNIRRLSLVSGTRKGSIESAGGGVPVAPAAPVTLTEKCEIKLIHLYGCTETTADCTFDLIQSPTDIYSHQPKIASGEGDGDEGSGDFNHLMCFGTPISNTEIYILDEDQDLCDVGEVGEICVSGESLALGISSDAYTGTFIDNEISKEKAFSSLFRSSDLGQIKEDQLGIKRLYFEGKARSVIYIKGQKVDLNKISRVINLTGLVGSAEMVIYRHERENQLIVAAVVLNPGVNVNDVRTAMRGKLEMFLPVEIFPISEIPILADGRMDRHAILHSFQISRLQTSRTDWIMLGYKGAKYRAARVLVEIISVSANVSIRDVLLNFKKSNYWSIGGTSMTAIMAVVRLKLRDYPVPLDDFVSAATLVDIVNKMLEVEIGIDNDHPKKIDFNKQPCELAKSRFKALPMEEIHKKEVIEILSVCYPKKGDIQPYTSVTPEDYEELLSFCFMEILRQRLSIVAVSRESSKVVGAIINVDINAMPKRPPNSKIPQNLLYILQLFDMLEDNAKLKFTGPQRSVLYQYMFGTSEYCSSADNVLLYQYLMKETKDRARAMGYSFILAISGQAIVKHLCRHCLKYQVLFEFPVNSFTTTDTNKKSEVKPYRYAPSFLTEVAYTKKIGA